MSATLLVQVNLGITLVRPRRVQAHMHELVDQGQPGGSAVERCPIANLPRILRPVFCGNFQRRDALNPSAPLRQPVGVVYQQKAFIAHQAATLSRVDEVPDAAARVPACG